MCSRRPAARGARGKHEELHPLDELHTALCEASGVCHRLHRACGGSEPLCAVDHQGHDRQGAHGARYGDAQPHRGRHRRRLLLPRHILLRAELPRVLRRAARRHRHPRGALREVPAHAARLLRPPSDGGDHELCDERRAGFAERARRQAHRACDGKLRAHRLHHAHVLSRLEAHARHAHHRAARRTGDEYFWQEAQEIGHRHPGKAG